MLSPSTVLAAIFPLVSALHGKSALARVAAVESRVASEKLAIVDPKSQLRHELEDELAKIDWRAERVKSSFELLAVLSEAESTAGKDGMRASMTVRIVLREPGGALLGQVSAHAEGVDKRGSRAALEAAVLEAASQKATIAIPEAVRKARAAR